ncbi:MAG TPA: 50S ribosomal protein L4 [Gemmatirosa sp.]|nr:50S ribosomal protein L4 [Gemmatirosa sp.]
MAETTNQMQAAAFTAQGAAKPQAATLPTEYFDGTVNVPVMHQAVKAYLANQRQGTHATKGRSMVTGGNQKPWRQKGTGRARQGSTRAPHWPGGGTYGGPKPNRDYSEKLTRKVRQLARKSALNARAAEGDLRVIDALQLEGPKTKAIVGLLATLGLTERKVLVLTDGRNEAAYLSARNLPSVHVMPYAEASTYHILWSDVVLVESAALRSADATTEEA